MECSSITSEVYRIEKHFLEEFISYDRIDLNYRNFINMKQRHLIDRLISIRNHKVQFYENEYICRQNPLILNMYHTILNYKSINKMKIQKIEMRKNTTDDNNLIKNEESQINKNLTQNTIEIFNDSSIKKKLRFRNLSKKIENNHFSINETNSSKNNRLVLFSAEKKFDEFYNSVELNACSLASSKRKRNINNNLFEKSYSNSRDKQLLHESQAELSSIINNSIFTKISRKSINNNPINFGGGSDYMEKVTRNKDITKLNNYFINPFPFDNKISNLNDSKSLKRNEINRYFIIKNKNRRLNFKNCSALKNGNRTTIDMK